MTREIIKERGLDTKIIKWFAESGNIKKVLEKLEKAGHSDILPSAVESFIKDVQRKSESPALVVSEYDAALVEKNMRHRVNLQEKTVMALNQAEDHVSEIEKHYTEGKKGIKCVCPKCQEQIEVKISSFNEKAYHTAKDSAIRTKNDLVKHLRNTQIKFMELAKNQVLRESIMEAIREVDPDVADKIFQKIEQKQRELGMI